MSRLRPFLYDRSIFVTVDLLRSRSKLEERDYARLAIALARIRQKQRFVLTAWVFLPGHWHAIIYPPDPVSISRAMSAVNVSSMIAINHGRNESCGPTRQVRATLAAHGLKDYWDAVEYIHLNPVRRGRVKRPAQWE